MTSLSTLAMIAYPPLFAALGFSETEAGILAGATIHDVAQVVGAGYAISEPAGDIAVYVKLLRVAMLPAVLGLILLAGRRAGAGRAAPLPWFAAGFVAAMLANSAGLVPAAASTAAAEASRWLLCLAIAAIGLRSSPRALRGIRGALGALVCAETAGLLLLAAALV